jgi:hypothetical protein
MGELSVFTARAAEFAEQSHNDLDLYPPHSFDVIWLRPMVALVSSVAHYSF